MKRRTLIIAVGCFVLSVTIVMVLYAISDLSSDKHEPFSRVFRDDILKNMRMLDCKYNSYYIAGATADHIYLGNFTAPLHILQTNNVLKDTQHILVNIRNLPNLKHRSLRVKVDSPYFFLMEGVMPYLLRGKIQDWQAYKFMYDSVFFTHAVPIGPTSFSIRALSSDSREYVLAKVNNETPHIKLFPGLLEKQIDGVFCVDGQLQYNKQLKQLIYMYYYRNQYIVMDSNLNLAFRANTIDTNRIAKIKVDSIRSKKSFSKSGPSKLVNRTFSTSGDWLYINSKLLSIKENALVFKESSVIDVYNLKNHSYHFSFYLPDYKEKKMSNFLVHNNVLFAVYDQYLISYDLNLSFTKYSKPFVNY